MEPVERIDHIKMLWRRAHIKAKAGASVLRFVDDLQRKIYLFGVSGGLNQIEKDEQVPPYILLPSDKIKSIWNIVTIILLFYTALFMPYKVAFLED